MPMMFVYSLCLWITTLGLGVLVVLLSPLFEVIVIALVIAVTLYCYFTCDDD